MKIREMIETYKNIKYLFSVKIVDINEKWNVKIYLESFWDKRYLDYYHQDECEGMPLEDNLEIIGDKLLELEVVSWYAYTEDGELIFEVNDNEAYKLAGLKEGKNLIRKND